MNLSTRFISLVLLMCIVCVAFAQPTITTVSPAKNSLNIASFSTIQITFSEAMNEATFIADSTINVVGSQKGLYSGAIVYNGGTFTATYTPDSTFKAGEVVTVTVTTGVQNGSAAAMTNPYSWSFTVISSVADTFAAKVDYGTGGSPTSITSADLDGDGDIDLAVSNQTSTLSVLLNNGNGTFAAKTNYAIGSNSYSITTADLDGDGDMDLATANANSNTISVLMNNGNGTFAAKVDYGTGNRPDQLTSADLDGDGDMDLAVTNSESDNLSVFMNNGNGTFASKVDYATGDDPRSIISADFDGDGDMDLAVANIGSTNLSVLLNNGNGTFAARVNYVTGSNPFSITSADLDGDGDMDLAVSNMGSNTLSVLKNNGNGIFASKVDYATGSNPASITSADLDGDGDMDLAVANIFTDNFSILKNNGNGTFAAKVDYGTGDYPRSITSADLDGDGDMDLAVGNYYDATLSVFINYIAPPAISYSAEVFNESADNVGSINNSTPMTISLRGDTLTGANGNDFVDDGKVNVTNLPSGLTAVITRTSSTTLSVTLTGNASSHHPANSVSDLTFAFQNSAFGCNDASSVTNSSKSDLSIVFNQVFSASNYGTTVFRKSNYANPTLAENQDRITDSVWITRGNNRGIYNAVSETEYTTYSSPAGTEWAYGTTADYLILTYSSWEETIDNYPPDMVGQDMVVHLIDEDIYIDLKFLSWQEGAAGGGFSYQRSIAPDTGLNYGSSSFSESNANDGSIDNSTPMNILLYGGDTFTGANGENFVTAGKVNVTNLPTGLTAVVERTSSTLLSVTITGNANNHLPANSVSNLTFTFQNSAFAGNDASAWNNYIKSDISIVFWTPQIRYVTSTGAGNADGSSWSNAFASLQSALSAAVASDTIWVAAGTYKPINTVGGTDDRYKTFQMKNGVKIYGGFAGIETELSQRDISANETILSGDIGSIDDSTDNCYHVFYHPSSLGLDSTAVLDGFTIMRGFNDGGYGGGMYNDGSSPIVTNCTFTSNSGYIGSGMYNRGSNPTITNCTFTSNSADCGGGMYNEESSSIINNCTFASNSATNYGGAMYNYSSSPTITNCTFTSNSAPYGGAINNEDASPIFTNCIFRSNSADDGGALGNYFCDPLTITNCTFSSNSADNGGGIYNEGSSPTLNNCIVWGNTATADGNQFYLLAGSTTTLNYCCYANGTGDVYNAGTFTATNNNITTDPMFVGSGDHPYLILGESPCVDAGNNSSNSQEFDIRGEGYPRKLDKNSGSTGTIDMGAYEYKVGNDPLPVQLTSLTATASASNATLTWKTATEVNNYGFEVERRKVTSGELQVTSDQWLKIGFVEGAGTSNSPKEYSYVDAKLSAGKYAYRLKQVDNNGAYKYSQETEVTIEVPRVFSLSQNYPNPFNPTTVIRYDIPAVGTQHAVSLRVFDILGKEVATLVNETKEAGSYEVKFDASKLASGVYFYKLQAGSFTSVKKLLLMK